MKKITKKAAQVVNKVLKITEKIKKLNNYSEADRRLPRNVLDISEIECF